VHVSGNITKQTRQPYQLDLDSEDDPQWEDMDLQLPSRLNDAASRWGNGLWRTCPDGKAPINILVDNSKHYKQYVNCDFSQNKTVNVVNVVNMNGGEYVDKFFELLKGGSFSASSVSGAHHNSLDITK